MAVSPRAGYSLVNCYISAYLCYCSAMLLNNYVHLPALVYYILAMFVLCNISCLVGLVYPLSYMVVIDHSCTNIGHCNMLFILMLRTSGQLSSTFLCMLHICNIPQLIVFITLMSIDIRGTVNAYMYVVSELESHNTLQVVP